MTEVLNARGFKKLLTTANDEADPQKKDYVTPLEALVKTLQFDVDTHELKKCDLLQNYLHDSPDADELVLILRSKNHRRSEHERRSILLTLLALMKTLHSTSNTNIKQISDKILRVGGKFLFGPLFNLKRQLQPDSMLAINTKLLLALLMELETTRKRLYEFLLVDSVNWRYLVKSVEFPEKKHFHDIFAESSVREALIPFAISYENDVIQEACLTCGTIGVYSILKNSKHLKLTSQIVNGICRAYYSESEITEFKTVQNLIIKRLKADPENIPSILPDILASSTHFSNFKQSKIFLDQIFKEFDETNTANFGRTHFKTIAGKTGTKFDQFEAELTLLNILERVPSYTCPVVVKKAFRQSMSCSFVKFCKLLAKHPVYCKVLPDKQTILAAWSGIQKLEIQKLENEKSKKAEEQVNAEKIKAEESDEKVKCQVQSVKKMESDDEMEEDEKPAQTPEKTVEKPEKPVEKPKKSAEKPAESHEYGLQSEYLEFLDNLGDLGANFNFGLLTVSDSKYVHSILVRHRDRVNWWKPVGVGSSPFRKLLSCDISMEMLFEIFCFLGFCDKTDLSRKVAEFVLFPELLSQSEERKDEIVTELKMIHRNGFNLELDKYASNETGSHAGKHAFLIKKLFGVEKLVRVEQFLGESADSEDIFWHADVFKQGIEQNDSLNFEKCVEFIKNNPEMDFPFENVVEKSGVNQKDFSKFLTDLVENEIFIKSVDSYLWNSHKFESGDRVPKTEEEKLAEAEKVKKVESELTPEQKMEKARQMMANPKAAKKAEKEQTEGPEKLMFGTDSYRKLCIEKRDFKSFEEHVEVPLIEEINAYKSVTLLEKLKKSATETNTLKINSLVLELTPENLKFEKWSDFTDLIMNWEKDDQIIDDFLSTKHDFITDLIGKFKVPYEEAVVYIRNIPAFLGLLKKQSKYSRFICRSAEIFSFVTKLVNEHVDLEKFDLQEVLDCLLESSVEDWLEFKETEYKLFWRSLKTLIDTGMLSKFVLNLLRNFIKIFPKELNKKAAPMKPVGASLVDGIISFVKRSSIFSQIVLTIGYPEHKYLLFELLFETKDLQNLQIFTDLQLRGMYQGSMSRSDLVLKKFVPGLLELEPVFGDMAAKKKADIQERVVQFIGQYEQPRIHAAVWGEDLDGFEVSEKTENHKFPDQNSIDLEFALNGLAFYIQDEHSLNLSGANLIGFNNGGILWLPIAALSSANGRLRKLALEIIYTCCEKFITPNTVKFPDREIVSYVLSEFLTQSEKNLEKYLIPVVYTRYMIHWLDCLSDPNSMEKCRNYNEMSKYFLHDPLLKTDLFPNFLRSWFCRDNSFTIKRKFVLEFATKVVGQCVNGHHYKVFAKLNICALFLSCFESKLTTTEEKMGILLFLEEAVKVEYVKKRLIDDEGLECWLDLINVEGEIEEVVTRVKNSLLS